MPLQEVAVSAHDEVSFERPEHIAEHRSVLQANIGRNFDAFSMEESSDRDGHDGWGLAMARLPSGRSKKQRLRRSCTGRA